MQIIIVTAIVGIAGMGVGGIISALLLKRPSEKIMCWMLSFASGIMTGIVCFSLIPEAADISNIPIVMIGLILGVVIIMFLNRIVDNATKSSVDDLAMHHTHEELIHALPIIENRPKMLRSGVIMLIAIGLHNLPEGIAIGAGGSHDINLGMVLALMILVHNLPEGMAIAAPLLAGGLKKWKVILITAMTGIPMLIGGLIGVLMGYISDTVVALSLALAGGAMLYVVFGEIIPQSVVMLKSRTVTLVTLSGIIVALALSMLH